ncbi:unnamed protein product [Rodentolepis nana]|uniref:Uncharacterized protein n=1 Tax=Rodentolepis nana TaxID=102285 RepID=A0A0R3TZ28_RODNA|nr:unnamed protein product [Rodentolepis nana]
MLWSSSIAKFANEPQSHEAVGGLYSSSPVLASHTLENASVRVNLLQFQRRSIQYNTTLNFDSPTNY